MNFFAESNQGNYTFNYAYEVVIFAELCDRGDMTHDCAAILAPTLAELRRTKDEPIEDFIQSLHIALDSMNPVSFFMFEECHVNKILDELRDHNFDIDFIRVMG